MLTEAWRRMRLGLKRSAEKTVDKLKGHHFRAPPSWFQAGPQVLRYRAKNDAAERALWKIGQRGEEAMEYRRGFISGMQLTSWSKGISTLKKSNITSAWFAGFTTALCERTLR